MIIDTKEQLDKVLTELKNGYNIIIPIFKDDKLHPKYNKISCLYISTLSGVDQYIIPIDHNESLLDEKNILSRIEISTPNFVLNKKDFLYFKDEFPNVDFDKLLDMDLTFYFFSNSKLTSDISTHAYDHYKNKQNSNYYIPLLQHIDYANLIKAIFVTVYKKYKLYGNVTLYDRQFIPALQKIESAGIHVDKKIFDEYFSYNQEIIDNKIYSKYNIYTLTGRASCAFGGINFLGIEKDERRKAFVSRFDNGFLVNFDYESYHLRLISQMLDVKFDSTKNMHEYLAKIYFNKDEITEEDYEKSKGITFKNVYGTLDPKYKDVELFKKIEAFKDLLWYKYSTSKFVETPIFKRRFYQKYFDDMSKSKLFNYILQAYETERNAIILNKLTEKLDNHKSKIILFTYDSILVDFHKSDGKELIQECVDIMSGNDNMFPVNIKVGKNYYEMIKLYDK